MKRFTESELKKYLKKEIEKIGLSEGWITSKLDDTVETNSSINIPEISKNEIVTESEYVKIEDVKLLEEEVRRMKELIDFRSPLLKKE